jgi:hypothetical protein
MAFWGEILEVPPCAERRAVTSSPESGFGTSRRPFFDFDFGATVGMSVREWKYRGVACNYPS